MEHLFSNLENHIREFRDKKILNSARKSIECICKIILKKSGVSESEYNDKLAKALIDYLTPDRTGIEKNVLKLLKTRLDSINTISSIDSHDNVCILNAQDFDRVSNDLDYIMNSILDTSIINFDIEIPSYLVQLYKLVALIENEDWKCKNIISLVYPNRKINDIKIDKKFSFSILDEEFSKIGYLFLGRNVSFTKTFQAIKELNKSNNIELNSLNILFPNEISKLTNKPIQKRKETIEEKAREIFEINHIKCEFIDKYILEKCLPSDISKFSDNPSEPYYIDQLLHHNNSTLKSSKFIEDITKKYVGFDESNKPIYLILGAGGAGKTTFCEESINIINQSKDKKAILISSSLINLNLNYKISENIESLQDLLRLAHPNLLSDIGEDRLEINIRAGNLIIVIDGIDEIISNFKDNFSIKQFIESITDLNDTYLNCTLIMTTRIQDNFIEQIKENKNLELYELKGFNKEAAEEYFNKRFNQIPDKSELIRKANNYLEKIKNNTQTSPLILRLISDLVTDNSGYDITNNSNSVFLKMPLDSIIYQVIEREILKQSLEVSCNDYLEILNEVVSSGGSMSIESFSEVTNIYSPNSNVDSFCISPLLKKENKLICIKYDALMTWFQSRFICHFLTSTKIHSTIDINTIETKLKPLSENFIKTELLQAIDLLEKDNKEEIIKHNIKIILSKIYENYEKISIRKISFNILVLVLNYFKPKEKEDLTNIIFELYPIKNENEIHGICILDKFKPLDFSKFYIHNSYFDGYFSLLKSVIPKEKTIFFNSKFINFDTVNFPRDVLTNETFDKSCSLDEGLKNILLISEDNIQKKNSYRKDDLFKILKCSYSNGTYGWKSDGVYKQQCNTLKSDLSLKDWLEILVKYEILEKQRARTGDSDTGYEVTSIKKKEVSDFIKQNLLSNHLKLILANINNK